VSPDSDVFRAVADPTRRTILDLLTEGELAVKELQPAFRISQPALSQHLRVLREAGLVSERRAGRLRIYRLEAGPLADLRGWLGRYERFWDERFDRLGRVLDGAERAEDAA
jgi:DNA-binding transcriptional ArsR family regulator